MKYLFAMIVIFGSQMTFAIEKPRCEAIGTRSEGWYLSGELMKNFYGDMAWDMCAEKSIECGAIGTRSEGWYTFTKMNKELIMWDNCVESEKKPICDAIGTRGEGWYSNGELMIKSSGDFAWDQCVDKVIECSAIGSKSEGWFSYEKADDYQLLVFAQCSEK